MLSFHHVMRQMVLSLVPASAPKEAEAVRRPARPPLRAGLDGSAHIIAFPTSPGRRALRCHQSPGDRRLTLISGSMRQVCEALDSLIEDETD